MIQEHKELLLQDLCARLPYGVKCKDININVIGTISQIGLHYDMCVLDKDDGNSESCYIPNCKPYLFPLSSMTEEQEEEFNTLYYRFHESAFIFNERFAYDRYRIKVIGFYPSYLQDWLNKNHFDYRGLISVGLAIDATGKNIY